MVSPLPDYNLGTAHGEIKITSDTKGADEGSKKLDEVKKKGGDTRAALDSTAKGAAIAGGVIAAGLAVAAKSAIDFESKMSAVKAVSGASADEMDKLSKKALQIGKDTSFSAAEGALAIEELVKAGVTIPDVMNGAADATVALAAAGEVALPEAAALASNAMNQFNLSAKDMPRVADLIAGAANSSAIDVSEFGQSLTQVGAVANLAGASFDDTAAAIALMGNAGIKGSDAGTSLKTMLQNLQPGTKKQTQLFKDLGIVTEDGSNQFYDAQGNLKSFADIAGILQGSLKGMTAAQKSAALETMFGTDAIRAAAIFSNQGADGFNKMAKSMDKVKAADVAKTRLDNVKGSLEALKGSLETAGIVLGQVLIPAIRKIVDGVTKLANAFLALNPNTQKTILTIAGIVGAVLLVVAAIIKIVSAAQKFIAILSILRTAMAATWVAALGPIALIIAAIVAMILIIKHLWEHNETFRKIVLAVWGAIKTAVAAVLSWFTNTLWPGLQAVWNGIVAGVQAVANFFKSAWEGFIAVVTAVWTAISTAVDTALKFVQGIIDAVLGVIMGVWQAFWNTFGGVITAVWNFIVALVKLYIKAVMFIIVTTAQAIWGAWKTIWNAIATVFKAVWNVIKAVVSAAVNFVKRIITTVWNAIKSVTSTVWNAIKSAVTKAINAVKGPVTSAVNAVKSVLSRVWNAIKTLTASVWNSLKTTVSKAITGVLNVVTPIVNKIKGIFSGAGKWLWDAGRNIIQGLIGGIESLINKVTEKLKWLTDLIPDVKGPKRKDLKLLRPSGQWIMEGLGDGIERGVGPVLRQLAGITASIPATANATVVGAPRVSAPIAVGSALAAGGDTYYVDKIEIPAADVAEFNNVIDFFGAINQKARAMSPNARIGAR